MNLAAMVEAHPADRPALVFEGEETSYGELRRLAGELRAQLAAAGVAPGDAVGLLLGASPAFVASYLAVLGSGAVAVPLNPQSPPAELDRELQAVSARLLLCDDVAPATSCDRLVVDRRGGCEAPPGQLPPLLERAEDDPAVYLFTSGTAGPPRAAVLSHKALHCNIEQMGMRVGLAARADDVGLLAVPPYHVLGLNAVLGVHLYAGAKLVLLERFDPAEALALVAAERVTLLAGVPQLFSALLEAASSGEELRSVRLACSGGGPLAEEVASRFEERFGQPLFEGYGLTEAGPAVTFPDLDSPRRPGSVGLPLPGVEVRVVDEDGFSVEPGDPGEILVRGANLFSGYLGDEAASRRALDGAGWLHTGDIGVFSEEGELSIVGRRKELVIVSGFNVYPGEVEEVLESHPLVAEAAVVGWPDERTGEQVVAFVAPVAQAWPETEEEPALEGAELLELCAARLARYKCPGSIRFLRQLPRNAQGKVLRRELVSGEVTPFL